MGDMPGIMGTIHPSVSSIEHFNRSSSSRDVSGIISILLLFSNYFNMMNNDKKYTCIHFCTNMSDKLIPVYAQTLR